MCIRDRFFFIIVMLYLVISLVNQVKANVPEAKNSALFTLILTLIVAVEMCIRDRNIRKQHKMINTQLFHQI